MGLAFMLWSSSLSNPLAYLTGRCSGRDWGVLQTIDAYPFSIEKAPDWAGVFVGGEFLAIIAAAVAVGTLSSENAGTRTFGGAVSMVVGAWCVFVGTVSLVLVFFSGQPDPGCTPDHITPLVGLWLIWIAMALLAVVAGVIASSL
ncbi:hypothetical protein ABZ511_03730 [Nocardia gamkensis]|uniref:hypothetical protein n=1 Tax=Nocardia gamkensis TaxID=352869 RepID=UPI0034035108